MGCIYTGGREGYLACIWEATARKIGNVHRYADFPGLTYLDFVVAAGELRVALDWAHRCWLGSRDITLGSSITAAIQANQRTVGTNTHLGIILLLMPLAAVFVEPHPVLGLPRQCINHVLSLLSVADARKVYEAIRLLQPGGMGKVEQQDLNTEPTVTLLEAMKLAADRDMVARQYANDFADVFDFGVPAFLAGFEHFGCIEAAIIDSQLRWLAEYPDSLIARKNGPAVAADVQRRAGEVLQLGGIATPEGRQAGVAFDRYLRSDGNKLNPGTTADLITACLFVALRENKVAPSAPFRWKTDEWL